MGHVKLLSHPRAFAIPRCYDDERALSSSPGSASVYKNCASGSTLSQGAPHQNGGLRGTLRQTHLLRSETCQIRV